jgi:hypothetical protein
MRRSAGGMSRTFGVLMAAVLALALAEGVALGSADQSGRYSASHSYDGVKAQVEGDSFNVDSGHCLVYTILVFQDADNRQMEGGLVRCDNATVDGSCNSGDKFIETWKGPGQVPGGQLLVLSAWQFYERY